MMKRNFLVAILALVLSVGANAQKAERGDSLFLGDMVIEYVAGDCDVAVSFPQLSVAESSPMAVLKLAENLNGDVCGVLAEAGMLYEKDSLAAARVNSAQSLEMFLLQQASMSESDQSELMQLPYELYSEWEAFANQFIVSMFQKVYCYSGGAHGMTTCSFLNYERKSGELFSFGDIIEDKEAFMEAVVKNFCKERGLSSDAMMVKTGLNCELSELPFPSEIGLCKKGIAVVYQPYEVAPYSMGVVGIILPFKDMKDILSKEFFDVKSKSGGVQGYNEKTKNNKK